MAVEASSEEAALERITEFIEGLGPRAPLLDMHLTCYAKDSLEMHDALNGLTEGSAFYDKLHEVLSTHSKDVTMLAELFAEELGVIVHALYIGDMPEDKSNEPVASVLEDAGVALLAAAGLFFVDLPFFDIEESTTSAIPIEDRLCTAPEKQWLVHISFTQKYD